MKSRPWTIMDEQILRNEWGRHTIEEVARLLRRSYRATATKAIKQGKKTTTTRFFPDGSYEVKEKDERYDVPNPAIKIHLQMQDRLLKIGGNFGFDPVSRGRLKAAMLVDDPKKAGLKAVFAAVFADAEEEADEQ